MTGGAPERYLVIKAKGGFGNRMLSATTGVVLAQLTGRVPVIDWRDGEYLPKGQNSYPPLFVDPSGIDVAAFDSRRDVSPAVWAGRLAEHPTDLIERDFPGNHSNPFIYRRLSIDLAHPERTGAPIAVFWSYLPKMARIGRLARRSARFRGVSLAAVTRSALAEYFTPNERVQSEVAALFDGRSRPVIGVHIRYTDRKVSLDRIIAEVTGLRSRMPEAQIFLATDNQGVRDLFCDRFAGVFCIDKAFGDDDTSLHEGVVVADPQREAENALVDMWALARCDWLVHSRHSTFSVAAALIGGIPRSRQRDIDRRNPQVVVKRWIQTWA